MSFTLATYNLLATAYIKPQRYARTPPELLLPERRIPALVDHVLRLDADVLCLQEVERATFDALDARLAQSGYTGALTMKGLGKPDGCAAFVRTSTTRTFECIPLAYSDAAGSRSSPSGHVAQILVVEIDGRILGVANTHLKWHPSAAPPDQRIGRRQIAQLLQDRTRLAPQCAGWIIGGDLNVTAESDVVAALREAGFEPSHAGPFSAPTCNANGVARMIDYLFYDAALTARPAPLPEVRDDAPMPGPQQPSDHVAVTAAFDWRT
jgi:mRNA deadenylase 3'-5' endonuclease subunit Ccr4